MRKTLNALAIVAVVGVIGVLGPATGATVITVDGDSPGICIIGPNKKVPTQRLGKGVIRNAKSVCDASVEGCGNCLELCLLFDKINDQFGCPLDGADGFCNPDFPNDPDCCVDADRDGFFSNPSCGTAVDCDDIRWWRRPGGTHICWAESDFDCDGALDRLEPACLPDGFCDARFENYQNPDCQPKSGLCSLWNERIINDMEISLGNTGILSVTGESVDGTNLCTLRPLTPYVLGDVETRLEGRLRSNRGGLWTTSIFNTGGSYGAFVWSDLLNPQSGWDGTAGSWETEDEKVDCMQALRNACG